MAITIKYNGSNYKREEKKKIKGERKTSGLMDSAIIMDTNFQDIPDLLSRNVISNSE